MNKSTGLLLVGLLALSASFLAQTAWAKHWHIGAMTIAIVLGMLLGNSVYDKVEHRAAAGVLFAKGFLLRTGIVLYGFKITLHDIGKVGVNAVISDALMLCGTFLFACWLGIRVLKIDRETVYLTASGCSICGAAAIMATEPVVKAPAHKVSIAVALIVLFGTVAMFVYPLLYPVLNTWLSPHQYGIYIGSSVHEVAQVYGAGSALDSVVADTAVITKMIRVMMLAPFLMVLSWYLQRNQSGEKSKIVLPWFAVYFLGVALFNSLNLLPKSFVGVLVQIDDIFLMMAMAALGLTTRIKAMRQAGVRPLLLGLGVLIWLMVVGFLVNVAMQSVIQ
ncbi:YeiH family protein [Wielerella bovis]|uniref:YeiH family protein n=1 Tax=Wielerella bovis TaxID=2917790 RepID=UPI0020195F22|nr:YeiH family putative sulfate export transporter [Wielerella bovis]ULJ61227.1 YeiH family putative sulfate export transporter [Wielerella bovis]